MTTWLRKCIVGEKVFDLQLGKKESMIKSFLPSRPFTFLLSFVKNIFGSERRKEVVLGIKLGNFNNV